MMTAYVGHKDETALHHMLGYVEAEGSKVSLRYDKQSSGICKHTRCQTKYANIPGVRQNTGRNNTSLTPESSPHTHSNNLVKMVQHGTVLHLSVYIYYADTVCTYTHM